MSLRQNNVSPIRATACRQRPDGVSSAYLYGGNPGHPIRLARPIIGAHPQYDMTNNDDSRHAPGSVLHLIKDLSFWGPEVVAADDADDDEREEIRRINAERAQRRESDQARWNADRYFIDEAVILIGAQRGLNEFVQQALCREMLRCAALHDDHKHKLTVRDPSTLIPVQHGVRVTHARIVYRSDVNAWLDAIGAGYRWGGDVPPAPAKRREKATTQHDNNIIAALRVRNIDPMKMPSPPLGNKPWALREEIAKELGITLNTAKTAFTRLRKDNRVKSG